MSGGFRRARLIPSPVRLLARDNLPEITIHILSFLDVHGTSYAPSSLIVGAEDLQRDSPTTVYNPVRALLGTVTAFVALIDRLQTVQNPTP
jgi:hypothetical protein